MRKLSQVQSWMFSSKTGRSPGDVCYCRTVAELLGKPVEGKVVLSYYLQGFGTFLVVVWDFWTINSSEVYWLKCCFIKFEVFFPDMYDMFVNPTNCTLVVLCCNHSVLREDSMILNHYELRMRSVEVHWIHGPLLSTPKIQWLSSYDTCDGMHVLSPCLASFIQVLNFSPLKLSGHLPRYVRPLRRLPSIFHLENTGFLDWFFYWFLAVKLHCMYSTPMSLPIYVDI